MPLLFRTIGLLACLVASHAAAQVTVRFQDGVSPTSDYAGTRDLLVKEGPDEAWSPTANYDTFGLGVSGTPDRLATLIRFDVPVLPAGTTVNAARLVFYRWGVRSPVPIYECLKPWVASAATFNRYDATNGWEVPGALGATDRGAELMAELPVDVFEGARTIPLTNDGLAVVRAWAAGTRPNHGFILQDYARTDGVGLGPLNDTSVNRRPHLELDLSSGTTTIVSTGSDTVIANGRDPKTRNYNGGGLNADGSPKATTLIKFDLTQVPSWSTVLAAGFTFEPVGDGTTGQYPLYESLRDWAEEATTWNEFQPGLPWAAPGGESMVDHGPTPLGMLTGVGVVDVPLNPEGVAVVQESITGTKVNRGFHILSFVTGDGIWMGDRESPVVGEHPQFYVTYREGRLAFRSGPALAGVIDAAGPFVVAREGDGGGDIGAGAPSLSVTVSSTSPTAEFASSAGGPWSATLNVAIGAGASTSDGFFFRDPQPGDPSLSASGGPAWTAGTRTMPVRRVALTAPGSMTAGVPSVATVQIVGPSGPLNEARPVEVELLGSQDARWTVGDLSTSSPSLAIGTTDASSGSAGQAFVETRAGTAQICARIAGAPNSGSCVEVNVQSAATDHLHLDATAPSQIGCGATSVLVEGVDAYDNARGTDLPVEVCVVSGPLPVIGTTTLSSEQRTASCITGVANDGAAELSVGPSAPGTVVLRAAATTVTATEGILELTWAPGNATPSNSWFQLTGGGIGATLSADGGTIQVELLPRDACDFVANTPPSSLSVAAPPPFIAGPLVATADGYTAELTLPRCPGSEDPIDIVATIDGEAIGQTVTLTPECTAPVIASTPAPASACGTPWTYAPTVVGDGPFLFRLEGAVPSGAAIDPNTGAVEWSPTNADRGAHAMTLEVSGPGGSTAQPLTVDVACERDDLLVGCGCQSAEGGALAFGIALLLRIAVRRRRR